MVVMVRPSRSATSRSCASWRGELSKTVTTAPAAGGQAQHGPPGEISREPLAGDGLGLGQDNGPIALPRGGDDLGGDRAGPGILGFDLAVPGGAVILTNIHNSLDKVPYSRSSYAAIMWG